MSNGDIRGLDISQMVPGSKNQYRSTQASAPSGNVGYESLVGAYSYAGNQIKRALDLTAQVWEDHKDLERNNLWLENQNDINNYFLIKDRERDQYLRSLPTEDLSFVGDEPKGQTTLNNYLNKEITLPDGRVLNLNKIKEKLKNDTALTSAFNALTNSKSVALFTTMQAQINSIQINRGKDNVQSVFNTIIDDVKNITILTHGTNLSREDGTDIPEQEIGSEEFNKKNKEAWINNDITVESKLQEAGNIIATFANSTGVPKKEYVDSYNKQKQLYMLDKIKQEYASLSSLKPDLILERYHNGYYNMFGNQAIIDKDGQIKFTEKKELVLKSTHINTMLSSLITKSKIKTKKQKQESAIALLKSHATQSYESSVDFLHKFTKINPDTGIIEAHLPLIMGKYESLSSVEFSKLQTIVDSAIKVKNSGTKTGLQDFPKDPRTYLNELANFLYEESQGETFSTSPTLKYNLTDISPEVEEQARKITEHFSNYIPANPEDLKKLSQKDISGAIVSASQKLPPYVNLSNNHNTYRSRISQYLEKKNENPDDIVLAEQGLNYPNVLKGDKPLTDDDINRLNTAKSHWDGSVWSPSSTIMDSWGELLIPRSTKNGKLAFEVGGVDTLSSLKATIMGMFENPETAKAHWKKAKKYWFDQGGELAVGSELFQYWHGPNRISDKSKVNIINDLSRSASDRNPIVRKEMHKIENDIDSIFDVFENVNQRDANLRILEAYVSHDVPKEEQDKAKVKDLIYEGYKGLSKGLVYGRLSAGNVFAFPAGSVMQYSPSRDFSKETLLFGSQAVIASHMTDEMLEELFPKNKEGRNTLQFGGKELWGYTTDQKGIIKEALLKGIFEGLSLTLVNVDGGVAPALFQRNPLSPNTKGMTLYVWDNHKIPNDVFIKEWLPAYSGVQWLERMEGIFNDAGKGVNPMSITWNDDNNKEQRLDLKLPFNTGLTYSGMLKLKSEMETSSKALMSNGSIDPDSFWPNEWYSPGRAELYTMESIEKMVEEDYKDIMNNPEKVKAIKKHKFTPEVIKQMLYEQSIDLKKKEWNSWSNRVTRSIDSLSTDKIYIKDNKVKVEKAVRKSVPSISGKKLEPIIFAPSATLERMRKND
tara:strand:- start:1395 stop:4712 length:3318 start_codon:yes stop_codon:yes gene_type:complete